MLGEIGDYTTSAGSRILLDPVKNTTRKDLHVVRSGQRHNRTRVVSVRDERRSVVDFNIDLLGRSQTGGDEGDLGGTLGVEDNTRGFGSSLGSDQSYSHVGLLSYLPRGVVLIDGFNHYRQLSNGDAVDCRDVFGEDFDEIPI